MEVINAAQTERAAAHAELDNLAINAPLGKAEIHAMIDLLGDVGVAIANAQTAKLSRLYHELRLELRYEPHKQAISASISPRVVSACVRGGIRTRNLGTDPCIGKVIL